LYVDVCGLAFEVGRLFGSEASHCDQDHRFRSSPDDF
jgi:hypothetical protein